MVCLIKEQYKKELKQYKDILGSTEAAYYVLAMNNGYTLDYTYEGKPSELYTALLAKNKGDVKLTIIDKSITFTPAFMSKYGDYTIGSYSGNLDKNSEPSILDINGGPLCDNSSISDILQEEGELTQENKKFIQILDKLEKNNFLIRDFTIQDALDFNRSIWTDTKLKEFIENNPSANVLKVFDVQNKAKKEWNKSQLKKLMGQTQQRLANYFDLEKVTNKDGTVYYKTKEGSKYNKLAVHFVNSLREDDWRDEDGNYHKGLFKTNDGTDAAVNLILISLEDGDPTTFIHELAHHYIYTFWNSDVVQKALSYIDEKELGLVRRFNKDPRSLEEKLVQAITDKVLLNDNKSWVSKFWFDFSNMIKKSLGLNKLNNNQKLNIIDQITMYMSINQDLSYNKADLVIYDYLKGVRFLGSVLELMLEIYQNTLTSLTRKRNAVKAKVLRDNSELSKIEYDVEELKSIDPTTQAFTDYMVNLVALAKRDLILLSTTLVQWSIDKNQFYNTPPKELVTMQTDILEYYAALFGSLNVEITTFIERGINRELSDQIELVRSKLIAVAGSYNARSREYINNFIEQQADQLITTGSKELFINNAKLWLMSQIDGGSLMFGENAIGIASQSKSPIIRLVEFLNSSQNNYVRRQVLPVGHKLYDLYKKCDFKMPFKNAMKMFFELDENGDPTGYLIRPVNYGRMFRDKDKLIQSLLEEYDGKVQMDDEGKFVFLDESVKNEFLDKKDDLESTICNKRYIVQYYKDKRRFLSLETIDILSKIQRQIDILVLKHVDSITGIPEIHKLTSAERKQLNDLYRLKQNLSNPYEILYSPDGKIRSFKEKTGTDAIVAKELMAWQSHLEDKLNYLPNSDKFEKDRKYLVDKYGENSNAVKLFDYYYSSVQISKDFYDRKKSIMDYAYGESNLPEDIKELYRRKSAIRNSVMDKRGHYHPHLERLNDLAWAELKRIDELITEYYALNPSESLLEDDEELEIVSTKELVKRYVNGKLTDQKYLLYLRDITEENTFYNKYYYTNLDGKLVPLSIFLYDEPLDKSYILTIPIRQYSSIDIESFYANPEYDLTDPSYILPKKEIYKNPVYDEIIGAKKAFYDYVLLVMQEANSSIPNYINTRSFKAPGMTENSSHLLFRKHGNFIKNCWHHFWGKYTTVSDVDVDYNEEIAVKPNGELVYTIPLRWIRKLEDPADTCTDLIGTVTMYYEMAMNYKAKSEFAPLVELIKTTMMGGTSAGDRATKSNDLIQRLEKYMEMYIYGKMRKGLENINTKKMSTYQKRVSAVTDILARNAVLKMMAHNIRGILKNFFDAGMSAIVETAAGKYFEKDDVIFGTGICGRGVFGAFGSINTPNNRNKVCAAMQYNGMSGNISNIFSGLRDSSTRRFISRFYQMGEYTFIDYAIKGWLAPAIYHNHRLVENFGVRALNINGEKHFLTQREALNIGLENEWLSSTEYRKEFMNKLLAIYNYILFGKTAEEGEKAWKQQNITAWDAFDIDEIGNFYLLPEYEDIVRPVIYTTGKRSTMTEDRISGVMRERFAVIAGMLPYENKGGFMLTAIGVFVFMLRGWLITFYWDCFRAGNDFSTWRKKSFFDKKTTSDQAVSSAEDIDFYQLMFEFETGQAGKGWHRGLGTLWKKLYRNGINKFLNFIKNANKATKRLSTTERLLLAKLTQYLLFAILCIAGSHLFGRLIEDDPDNLIYNIGYSESLALTPERTTQINPLSALDLIKNATSAQSYLDEINTVLTVPYDFYISTVWGYNYMMGDPEFEEDLDKIIKTGSYGGVTKSTRNLLKASSVVAPGLGINNIFKNLRPEGHKAYQTWLLGLIPNSWLLDPGILYKPDKSKTKTLNKKPGNKRKSY